jgi:hypothetical protein
VNYKSNEDYFAKLNTLAGQMEQSGHVGPAARIRQGILCVNGLTDGWAMLMEELDAIVIQYGKILPQDQLSELERALEAAQKAVFRR